MDRRTDLITTINYKELQSKLLYSDETTNNLINAIYNYDTFNRFPLSMYNDDRFTQWLVGFVDGEGSFKYYLRPNPEEHGIDENTRAAFSFVIELHKDDYIILEIIRNNLNLNNNIHYSNTKDCVTLNIGDHNILINIIIPLFDKYPLLTKKGYDYYLWRDALLKYHKAINKYEILLEIADTKKLLNKYYNNKDPRSGLI